MRHFLIVLAAILMCSSAPAAVRSTSGDSVIELAGGVFSLGNLPTDFSVLLWVRADETVADARSIFEVPGVFRIGTDAEGRVEASAVMKLIEGGTEEFGVVADGVVAGGQWTLIAMVYRGGVREITLHVRTHEGGWENSAVFGLPASLMNSASGGARLGHGSDGRPALVGLYGLVCVRSHTVGPVDVLTMYQYRRYFGGYVLHTAPSGSMNGPAGALWMMNHAMTTQPTDVDAGGERHERAAVVGEAVGRHNVHVFDRQVAGLSEYERFNRVRGAAQVSGFVYESVYDDEASEWFVRDPGPFSATFESVGGPSPLARRLATQPHRLMRVMISSNSRAVSRSDGTDLSPGNYTHGFIDLQREHTAGVFFRPATRGSLAPWFGLDCTEEARSHRAQLIDATFGKYGAFSRMWTGSARGPSQGPGAGLFVENGGFYEMRAKPEPGSLMTADKPLVVEAHVIAFPGASTLMWQATRGRSQGDVGIAAGPPQVLDLNTQRYGRLWGPGDSIINPTAIRLDGDWTGLVEAGDAIYVVAGPGAGQLHIVSRVTQGIFSAIVEFTMPMLSSPSTGSDLRVGPWRFETVRHEFDAIEAGDENDWRGLRLEASGGNGFAVFAFNAWRPNVRGFVFGMSGWGGNGYLPQLLYGDATARRAWMEMSQSDLWLVVPAQQNSVTANMRDWTAEIRAALPQCEVVWAGEGDHPSGQLLAWPTYIVNNAAAEGVVGVVAFDRPGIGTSLEQLGDGHRSNLPHLSRRGNLQLAKVWSKLLLEAATDPCPADLAAPWGVYDFFDVQVFLSYFAGGDPLGDLNGDGVLDFFDVQMFLGAFSGGCP